MKEENEIDQLFQTGLNKSYEYDEQLWKKMEPQLPSNDPNKSFWHFSLNSIPLFLIILSCAFIPTDTVKSLAAKPVNDFNKKEINSRNGNESSEISNQKNNDKHVAQTITSNLSEKVLDSKFSTEKNNQTLLKQNKNNSVSSDNIEGSSIKKKVNRKVSPKTQVATFGIPDIERLKNSSISRFKNESELSLNKMKQLDYILFNFSTTQTPVTHIYSDKLNDLQDKVKPKFYYLEIETYRSIDLSKKLSGQNKQMIDYKNSSETPLYREGVGINLLKDFKWLTIGIGLHYSKYIERANYSYDDEKTNYETSYDTSYRLVNRNFTSNGNPVFLIEENIDETVTENKVISRKQLKVRNEFKRLQVPVIVGYQHSVGRWVAGVQSAFVFNYLTESSGIYIQDNLDSFKNFEGSNQLNTIVYSQKNQLNLGFSLNEFILVGGRFSHEYDINSFTKDYNSKFQSYNLGVWVQWRP